MQRFTSWLRERLSPQQHGSSRGKRRAGDTTPVARRSAEASGRGEKNRSPQDEPEIPGEIDSLGPGKNVLIRKKYVREETGTHDTLKIVDDSLIDSGEESGIDPYNTGSFDRSKNWDNRFRK